MADTRKYVQNQATTIAGSGATTGDTALTLTSFTQIDGTELTITDFGTKGYGTLEPGSGTNEEQISFTGVTQNANGTATLTGVYTVLTISPYTETSGLAQSHSGGVTFVISNTAGFYNTFANRLDDETIDGTWTFSTEAPFIPTETSSDTTQAASIGYVNAIAIQGVADASTTVKGASKLSAAPTSATDPIAVGDNDTRVPTQNENNALVGNNTDIAVGTGNKYVTQTGLQKAAEVYAATATGNDTYVVTLSPVPTSLTNGMLIRVKVDVGNTGAATLNPNSLGAITIKKAYDQDLVTGDIEANQIIDLVYNSTGPVFQMQSQTASPSVTVDIQTFTSSGTWTKPTGALKCLIEAWGGGGGSSGVATNEQSAGAGGGGYIYRWIDASTAGATETVTIGAAGAAGASGHNAGTAGGNTTFGSLLTATGGLAGPIAVSTGSAGAGADGGGTTLPFAGGAGSSGAVGGAAGYGGGAGGGVQNGAAGQNGGASLFGGPGGGGAGAITGGSGGASLYGGGAGGAGGSNAVGTAGTAPGGGAGGSASNAAGDRVGAAGSKGQVKVTTYM